MSQQNSSTAVHSITITKETAHRLAKDIRDITKNSLNDMGIYYIHHDTNMLKGYALIIGPENTLYEGGYFFFNIDFPPNYPHAPPLFTFLTNDGETRMNPNLYRNGKVCLSILNTWHGEPWSGCQTIRSVLLSICSTIFVNTPLLNEPGITKNNIDYEKYNSIIEHQTIKTSILKMLDNCPIMHFKEIIQDHFNKNYSKILKKVNEKCKIQKNKKSYVCATKIYNMMIVINYPFLKKELKKVKPII